ncbi:hypothetical protein DAETH_42980 (plasmid) [Deinococcus aetherius]|uniref:Uncharacterized protein n=1 Tax=Deinococcus aetherius TaxID=200252 RepID=A0ABM8AKT3_9DEIO|nr:hypothetical protein DAETH_42980 [Deinococcus aetherius]
MLHSVEHGEFSNGCPVTPKLVSMDELRNLELTEQTSEEGSGSLRIPVWLKQEVEYHAMLVDGPP